MGSCQKVFERYMQDDNYNPIKRDGFLVVKRDYKCVRIPIDDILFVDCDKDYIRFHLEGRPNIRTLGNLKQLEERLPREKFKRVHRSFLANMTKFDTVDQQHITYGDQSIPISETYFEFIKKYLEDHSL
jgi:response regulator receiver domain protein